ncbi:hypothetical protein C8J57DRAFT_1299570 [Mycena rebaudengoi]|nr:hypothetical protein C8J57DRAFT_1299570 [Mycena rebaudengoi]
MALQQALIPYNPDAKNAVATIPESSRPDGSRWALFLSALSSPSPGRTFDQMYASVGRVIEKQANRAAYTLGLGPHVVAKKIKLHFGNGEERVQRLKSMRTLVPPKLEKWCQKIMKYTLPTESANMQCQAFKDIVELATLFPGLRVLFLRAKCLYNLTSIDAITAHWNRVSGSPDEDWTFWQTLAATCLTDTTVSAILEGTLIADWSHCQDTGLSVIEHLLIEHNSAGASNHSNALCLRYLGGILDLPGFWLDNGKIHSYVANKLCFDLNQLLKDIGVDILALGLIVEPEPLFDYNSVDFLAVIILTGISGWFSKLEKENWELQPWYGNFKAFLHLLRMPRAAELLPHSSDYANNTFDDILPTIRKDAEINVPVDGEDRLPANQDKIDNGSMAELECKTKSTPSLRPEASNPDHERSGEFPLPEDQESRSQRSDMDPVDVSSLDDAGTSNESPDFVDGTAEFGSTPGMVESSTQYGDSDPNDVELRRIASIGLADSIPSPSLEARRKRAEEHKLILSQRQRDLGDDHPDTLQAMEDLAYTQFELGEFESARDLRVVVLEKRRLILGENHSDTLRTMGRLGWTCYQLGQYSKAESLGAALLEKQNKLLGEDHPDTLQTMKDLAETYRRLGQLKNAENLHVQALEKQRGLLGDSHPDTLRIMGGLAATYHQLGRFMEAEILNVQVLEKYREFLGEDHQDTLRTMGNLGLTYSQLGKYEKAKELELEVLEKQRKLQGEDHPDTLRTMGNLAATYLDLGQLSAAEELGVTVLDKQKKVLGEDHPDTLYTMGSLAVLHDNQGQFERAEKLHVVVREKQRRIWGNSHNIWGMRTLRKTYHSLGRVCEVEGLESVLGDQEI